MKETRKVYASGDLKVVWQPALCIHSEKCFHGLPAVFDPRRRPWVQLDAAEMEDVIAQVKSCPSGALSIETDNSVTVEYGDGVQGQLLRDGPLLIDGRITLIDADGKKTECEGKTAFCRCGASNNKPYCDGSHQRVKFTG